MRVRDVFAIYDNNISPGLLMIIIKKIIILYFIQIRHTDDFPPTGTPASVCNKPKTLFTGSTCSSLYYRPYKFIALVNDPARLTSRIE